MRAVTRSLSHFTDKQLDLNNFARGDGYLFVRDGVGVAGRGVAARVEPNKVIEFLQNIAHENLSGISNVGPIAIGCIPFESSNPHEFVIPSAVFGKNANSEQWVTLIDDAVFDFSEPATQKTDPAKFSVRPGVSIEHYLEAVRLTRTAVLNGEIAKAVIARDIFVETDLPFNVHAILLQLKSNFGSSYRYLIDGLIGASPELLIAVNGQDVRSHPLAGTVARTGDPETDHQLAIELIASTKNQLEHRIVIDMVHDTLLPWCSYLDWQPEPSIVEVANVQHLGTEISGRLSEPKVSVLELAYALSPTPALGGHPRKESLAQIKKVEGFERGRYGGAVGYVDANGDGIFAVTIRCAELNEDRTQARLFAGGGIVGDSDPDSELAETQAKFKAMLAAITHNY